MDAIPQCDWSHPNTNRYTGNVAAAIAHYDDIPKPVRDKLIARATAKSKDYDDVATITKDGIIGRKFDYTGLRQMYFGINRRCEKVVMPTWPFDQVERALLFTEYHTDGKKYTVMIPTVCGNVSRVDAVPHGTVIETPIDPKLGSIRAVPAAVNAVPEPSTMLLVALALPGLLLRRRK